MTTHSTIQKIINDHDVVLFMKGSPDFPQCGFSATAAAILSRMNVQFHDVDVLTDDGLRQDIKEYSNWPTIPQLYIKGEFIGGCDILREMHESGDINQFLTDKKVAFVQ